MEEVDESHCIRFWKVVGYFVDPKGSDGQCDGSDLESRIRLPAPSEEETLSEREHLLEM